ncbi:MAG: ATP-binding cassette domain-containing protein [Clostridia bacterium]|nr:ATP-binding cassette domain-containing protein [Clostridia bacterium]
MSILFEIENLRCSYDKKYREGVSKVVLEIRHLSIPKGKKIFIVGESGIGKSTILETLGMMNNTIIPDENTSFIFNPNGETPTNLKELWKQKDKTLSEFRKQHYSFIFQNTNLMKNFTAFENIAFTRMLQGYSRYSSFQRTKQILMELGLEHIDKRRMAQELSGGQQQRLAFARAIVPDFSVLFGDEPTGNLDAENAIRVMRILNDNLSKHAEASAIIVSHDMRLATSFADVIIKIKKCIRPKVLENSEDIVYGKIDDSCVYMVNDNKVWSNGIESFELNDFENFLRRK